MVIDSMFVYHFVDPDQRVETIFRMEGTVENEGIYFETGCRHHCTLVLTFEENFMQSLSAFFYFFW